MFVKEEESIQKILSGNMNKKPNQIDWVFYSYSYCVSYNITLFEFIHHTIHRTHIRIWIEVRS